MSTGESLHQGGASPNPILESRQTVLIFKGEGVEHLTYEYRNLLRDIARQFAGGRAVEATLGGLPDVATSEAGKNELESVPITRDDYVAFALEHGYPKMRAWNAWNAIVETARVESTWGYRFENERRPLPSVQVRFPYDEEGHGVNNKAQIVNLRSVEARLRQSDLDPLAWAKGSTKGVINFLVHIVNEKLQPDNPLPVEHID